MRFAASNIAWSYAERLDAYALLRDHGFTGLEIAPGLLFADEADPMLPSTAGLRARRAEIEKFGLTLVSMQSLLFGVDGASLFGEPEEVERLVLGLDRAIALAGALGIGNLVFGSPKQRIIPPGMSDELVLARAIEVFHALGDRALSHGTRLALEPNAPTYGTNFMTDMRQTLDVVRAVDHPAITLNFDIGALHMTSDFAAVSRLAEAARTHISHVHISAPQLAPAPASTTEAQTVLDALSAVGFDEAVSVEIKAVPDDGLAALAKSIGMLRDAALSRGHL